MQKVTYKQLSKPLKAVVITSTTWAIIWSLWLLVTIVMTATYLRQ